MRTARIVVLVLAAALVLSPVAALTQVNPRIRSENGALVRTCKQLRLMPRVPTSSRMPISRFSLQFA
jgi:hypothetical protein